jgi:hypothetical protein
VARDPEAQAPSVINGDRLHYYQLTVGLWDDQGWSYGPCSIVIRHVRHWWVACPGCGAVAVATWGELASDAGVCCPELGTAMTCGAAMRPLRWRPTQAEATAAYLLGGHEAVKALVAGEAAPVIEPVHAHVQEAEPEAPRVGRPVLASLPGPVRGR